MSWYTRVLDSIKAAIPFLNVSQTSNLALPVGELFRNSSRTPKVASAWRPSRSVVQTGCPDRVSRLLVALTITLSWLTLVGLPGIGAMPRVWHKEVVQWGRVSVLSLDLERLDHLGSSPLACSPSSSFTKGGTREGSNNWLDSGRSTMISM